MAKSIRMKARRLTIRAAADSAGKDPLRPRRFTAVAYTGGMLKLANHKYPLVIDIEGLSLVNDSQPVLYGHEDEIDAAVGHTTKVAAQGNREIVIEGVLTPISEDDLASRIIAKHDAGHPWQVSVGCDIQRKELIPAGESVEVNGQTFEGPVIIARESTLSELSFVVLGADERTSAVIAARKVRGRSSVRAMQMNFEDWLKSMDMDPASMTPEQLDWMKKVYAKLPQAQTPSDEGVDGEGDNDEDEDVDAEGDGEDDEEKKPVAARKVKRKAGSRSIKATSSIARQRAAEHRRIAAIEASCARHPEIMAKALENGWTPERAELEVLRASRASAPRPQADGAPPRSDVIEAAMMMSVGIEAQHIRSMFSADTIHEATQQQNRNVSLHMLMDDVIHASGGYFRGSRKTDAFIKAALDATRVVASRRSLDVRAAGNFTAVSFDGLLMNVAQKTLKASYDAAEVVWNKIADVGSNIDFKPATRIRLDSQGAFKKVGPDGELKHAGLSDAVFSNQLDTWGTIISLNRQMMINDDLNGFLRLPMFLGKMGAISIEEEVFKLILSNAGSFFSTGSKNLIHGTEYVLSLGALSSVAATFRRKVDTNGKPILTSPKKILVPTGLYDYAQAIYESDTVNETTTANKPSPVKNSQKGKYEVITSPYLDGDDITDAEGNAIEGQSATAWYMLADPKAIAAILVCFLNGNQAPTIQSSETEFSTLGMQWRAFQDVGFSWEDTNGMTKVTGVVAP
jgi:hypothetical protein